MKNLTTRIYTGTAEEMRTIRFSDHCVDWDYFNEYLDFMNENYEGEIFDAIFVRIGENETFIILPTSKEHYKDFVGEETKDIDNNKFQILGLIEKYHNYPLRPRRAIDALIEYAEEVSKKQSISRMPEVAILVAALEACINKIKTTRRITAEEIIDECNRLREEN